MGKENLYIINEFFSVKIYYLQLYHLIEPFFFFAHLKYNAIFIDLVICVFSFVLQFPSNCCFYCRLTAADFTNKDFSVL